MSDQPSVPGLRRGPGLRRLLRLLAVLPALAVLLTAHSAAAVAPDTWADTPAVSTLHVLLVLVVFPVGLFALIALLVYLPSMSRGSRYSPGQAWSHDAEWFGGPREGAAELETGEDGSPRGEIGSQKADEDSRGDAGEGADTDADAARPGGASGRW